MKTKQELEDSACDDGSEYLKSQESLHAAWENCERADWMLWALGRIGYSDKKIFVIMACWCARETPLKDGRKTWDLLTDERSRNGIETAERWTSGEYISKEELLKAKRAAYAAYASNASYAAAAAAADAAAAAYAADAAADAAAAAAYAAAYAAAAAADAAADAAAAAARTTARKSQADKLRELVSNPFDDNK